MAWLIWLGGIVGGAYLLGSFPTGYLAGRLLKGLDIRDHGSGSTGATNVLRVLGKGPGLVVLLVDILKGATAVLLTQWLGSLATMPLPSLGMSERTWLAWLMVAAGLGVLLGHSRSIFLGFSGGKSVASGLGVLLSLHWPTALTVLTLFAVVLVASRIVSLGSVTAAIAAPVVAILYGCPLPLVLFLTVAGLYIVFTHRNNIQRILQGTEFKLGQGSKAT
ncbi:MAG: glycerol-3-phosphate 1-O-acyltransferase PlsY [Cyanobacteria bacterium P01_A01_bin.135]